MCLDKSRFLCLFCRSSLTTHLFIVPIERKVPPTFTKKPSAVEDTEGKMVKLEGRVSGSQPLTVNWYKDGTEIFSSASYDISFKTSVAMLCIKKSQLSDSGTYTCKVTNEAGTASCEVSVHITGIHCLFLLFVLSFSIVFLQYFSRYGKNVRIYAQYANVCATKD